MTAAGLLNQATVSAQPHAGIRANPMASSSSTTDGTQGAKSSASGITANDFLTLLVTEMKNQDPTANTDPNEYINQLVNVNSLQQLISINETVTGAMGASNATTSYSSPTTQAGSATSANSAAVAGATGRAPVTSAAPGTNSAPTADANIQTLLSRFAHGNLSAPDANPAASRMAHALDGRTGVLGVLPSAK